MQAAHLSRYKDIAVLLVKHRHALGADDDPSAAEDARALADQLEALGPTFVKLGQLLSTRSDLLPSEYTAALARLQERVEPFPFDEVQRAFHLEFGARISNAFASFDEKPVAAASLGQVHRATLRDGRRVAVKVQRPDVRERIVQDMDAIEELATLADNHTEFGRRLGFAEMVAEFRRSLLDELDYRREAGNLQTLGDYLSDHPEIFVPQPVADYSAATVLTMDFVEGTTVGSLSNVGVVDIDGPGLALTLFRAYLDQILLHGFFHADPHPGNVVVMTDGRLGLIDLGMVARVEAQTQDSLIKLLLAIGEGRGRDAADITIGLGRALDGFDPDAFRRGASDLISRNQGATMGQLQAGAVISELTQVAGRTGLRLPPELTMLGKALLNLDEVARKLDPNFDPNAAIRAENSELMRKKLLQTAQSGNVMAAALEAKEFVERLPGRVNQVLDSLAAGEFTLNVKGIDEEGIMRSAQKLANRLTAGIVVAAMVVGAALIMRIPTRTQLFGYPALAIVMFLLAAAAGIWLFVSIQLSDLPQRRRKRP